MQLFYNNTLSEATETIVFDKTESRHIVRVLRKVEGDTLQITNGKSQLFFAEITFANDKRCHAKITRIERQEKPWPYTLHIAIAPTKNNDRYEWFLEKATEIGIDEITPIICHNSERRVVKTERFQKIVVAAMKQSLKHIVPIVHEPVSFDEFIEKNAGGDTYIAHCEDGVKTALKCIPKTTGTITILIGPEGDFSPEEIKKALAKKINAITLGNSRLRTETAGVTATHSISFIYQ